MHDYDPKDEANSLLSPRLVRTLDMLALFADNEVRAQSLLESSEFKALEAYLRDKTAD